jgi:hypothetical protein
MIKNEKLKNKPPRISGAVLTPSNYKNSIIFPFNITPINNTTSAPTVSFNYHSFYFVMESTQVYQVNFVQQPLYSENSVPTPYADLHQQSAFVQPTHVAVLDYQLRQSFAIQNDPRDAQVRLLNAKLEKAKKKYQKYVAVAATTPSYFWIPVAGTVTAPVIAGVYGRRAALKKKEIDSK